MRSVLPFSALMALVLLTQTILIPPAQAIIRLKDRTINDAITYGLRNQNQRLSDFLQANWLEDGQGDLLNVYSPFMQLAQAAAKLHLSDHPTAEDIADARKKLHGDVDYFWQHQNVRFMVSLIGDSPDFARHYFAMIEGVGQGRSYTLYPDERVQQYLADRVPNVTIKPYSAINTYVFKMDEIMPLQEFTVKLYGKDLAPIYFKIINDDLQ